MVYGGNATFRAGVGEEAREDARIVLEGLKNSITERETLEANYIVWQKMADKGSTKETLVLPIFSGPNAPTFKAAGGITVQIPEGSPLRIQVEELAKQPGMAYLNPLLARDDVNWQPVKLAFETWNYKQEGLTPAGAGFTRHCRHLGNGWFRR